MAMTKISAGQINWDAPITSATVSIDLISHFKTLSKEETVELVELILEKLELNSTDLRKLMFSKENLL